MRTTDYDLLATKLALFILAFLLISFTTYSLFQQQHAYTQTPQASSTTVVMPLGSSAATTAGKGYEPDPVIVAAGSTVIWKNEDNVLHTGTSGDAETATPDGKFDTSYLAAGQSSKPITMPTQPGEYPYFCTLHPFLTGTLKVVSSQVKGLPISPENTMTTGKDNAAMEPINILLDDAIVDLEKGDVQKAVLHLDLAKQQLVIFGNSSFIQLANVLVDDAIQDLQNSDSTAAVVHLNLAKKQLSILDTSDTLQRNLTITSPIQQEQAITNNQSSMSVNQTTGPPFTTIPSNLTAQYIPPLSSPIPQQGPDWIRICNTLQPALLSPCNVLVNPDGTLTSEGNRGLTCIRNGALLAAGSGLAAIPLDWIAMGLQFLEGPTGCGGIVNWNMINEIGSVDTILNLIPG